jgi:hypothetical protein
VPAALGRPDATYVTGGERPSVSLVYAPRRGLPQARETGVGLLVTELQGDLNPQIYRKVRTGATKVIFLKVGPYQAVGLEGGPHVVYFYDAQGTLIQQRTRLAANVLLFVRGGVLIRMEGAVSVRRLAAIAKTLR